MRGADGEWHTVSRKGNQRRTRVENGVLSSRMGGEDSFYMTNFPGSFTINDLRNLCSKHGRVSDVYISQKLSKLGKLFAFVRFFKGQKAVLLEEKLRSICIGSYHLFARYARFAKIGEVHGSFKTTEEHARRPGIPIRRNVEGSVHASSYANVVKKGNAKEKPQHVLREVLSIPDSMLVSDDELPLSLLVAIAKPKVIQNFKSLCAAEGFGDVVVRNVYGKPRDKCGNNK
ncbi:hypothetical protein LXL04_006340 [Taraxacum kok-saghyz]